MATIAHPAVIPDRTGARQSDLPRVLQTRQLRDEVNEAPAAEAEDLEEALTEAEDGATWEAPVFFR
jgi:hypothetical protein